MNLAQLRALRAVHITGSVTHAARMLKVTQSAVSHALNSLETELAVRLIIRDRAGCSLTQAGRDLLPHAIEALNHVDQIEMKARALGSRPSGILRLGLPPSTRDITQPLIRAFVRRCPEVEVVRFEGTVEEVGGWIDRGLVEVGVVASEQPGMDAVPLVEDEIVVITAQADERAARPGISLADLQADPFVLYLGYERVARSLHEEHGMTLNPVHRVWQMSTLLEMVKAGLGVSVVSSLALNGVPDGIAVVPLCPARWRRLWLAAGPGRSLSPAGRAFLDHVGAVLVISPG
jgi:DNA-binding transcriptional LysR family regulator